MSGTFRIATALGLAAFLVATTAIAAPRAPKKTTVHFGGDTIDGSLMRPDDDLFQSRPSLDLPSLVKPPKSFERASKRDLMDAADALKER